MIKWIKKFIRTINLFLIGLTLISYFSPTVSPETLWFMPFFSLALPVFLFLNVVMLVFLFLINYKSYWLNAVTIALSFIFLSNLVAFNTESPPELNPTSSIRVLTFNALGFKKYRNFTKNDDIDNFKKGFNPYIKILKQTEPTILCFQEAKNSYPTFKKHFHDYLKSAHQLGYNHVSENKVLIFSKYPIINKGVIIQSKTNSSIFADVKIDTAIVRFYNIQLQSTGIAPDAKKLMDNPNMENQRTKKQVKNIVVRLKRANDVRARQVAEIRKHLEGCPYPMILCGDFNDIPFSYTYHQLTSKLNDSFVHQGNGIGRTYNGAIPFLRIDYILASPVFKFNSHQVIYSDASDHFPVFSKMTLR